MEPTRRKTRRIVTAGLAEDRPKLPKLIDAVLAAFESRDPARVRRAILRVIRADGGRWGDLLGMPPWSPLGYALALEARKVNVPVAIAGYGI